MYILYWAPGCGSFAPHAALNEVGAPYELIEVDLGSDAQFAPDFLAVNPRAQVPALRLPDGIVMTESVAMLMHIADSYPQAGLLPAVGSAARAIAYRWLVFSAVNLYEAGCRISDTHHYCSDESGYEGVRSKARDDLERYWDMVMDAVGDGPYLLGSRFSVVDICLLMIAQWHAEPERLLHKHARLATLCDAVRRRPAVDEIWDLNFASG